MSCIPDHWREGYVPRGNEPRRSESQCTGFCRLLKFDINATKEVKSLIITMVMAVLGSQEEGVAVARSAGVIKNTPALIVTEGYVEVCCTSLKKVCAAMKKHILK